MNAAAKTPRPPRASDPIIRVERRVLIGEVIEGDDSGRHPIEVALDIVGEVIVNTFDTDFMTDAFAFTYHGHLFEVNVRPENPET